MSFLDLQGITASYGPSQALFGVDIQLERGEVCALMGRNGGTSQRFATCFHGWVNGATSLPDLCPVANSRCWRSDAP